MYIAIDLKSFYASVECVERGLDPLTTNLVVADESRTEKTICLAVSPSLKSYGVPGRARLFEVVQKVRYINAERRAKAPGHRFTGASSNNPSLLSDPSLELSYIVAKPRMAFYMDYSTKIYSIYLKYFAPEDIHVYSIDEVFIDISRYMNLYKLSPRDLTMKIIQDVLHTTGITATAGIGTNMYLSKIAMDIEAKHIPADKDGVRIAELDEMSYRVKLWEHTPLTDFWRIGGGISKRLEQLGLFTMGDIARCSLDRNGEELLYKTFGVNAELIIDHAWGYEPCTISEIKAYKPDNNSLSVGQVLSKPYPFEKGKLIVREMTDSLVLDLVEKGLMTNRMSITVCYDTENTSDVMTTDRYGRSAPRDAHGSTDIMRYNSSTKLITEEVMKLYDRIVSRNMTVRRMFVIACNVLPAADVPEDSADEQLDFFTDYRESDKRKAEEDAALEREGRMQQAILSIKNRYGKNAILKGMNFEEDATGRERNEQVGGHKA